MDITTDGAAVSDTIRESEGSETIMLVGSISRWEKLQEPRTEGQGTASKLTYPRSPEEGKGPHKRSWNARPMVVSEANLAHHQIFKAPATNPAHLIPRRTNRTLTN